MRPCFGKRKLLAWLALGELDDNRAHDLRAHVQACERCRRYLETLSALKEKLAAAETKSGIEPSASFHREWVARLRAEPSASVWQLCADRFSWRVALPALGAAAVLVILGLSLVHNRSVSPSAVETRGVAARPPAIRRDLSPSVANYQRVASRSLDEFDELLTAQAKRRTPPVPTYVASTFAAATSPN